MRKTIEKKRYDTATAKAMGNWQRGLPSERGYILETLYQKKTGEYFLHCQGGSRSRYAQRIAPNTWGSGERVIPFSEEEANAWADNHLTDAAYNVVFEEAPHESTLTAITLMLSPSTIEKLHQQALLRNCETYELAEEVLAKNL